MSKYQVLLNVLDALCSEAPKAYKSYYPRKRDVEKVLAARARAFIHLYLKVKFALNDFEARHALITDGGQDGGLDAYYISRQSKELFLIQSKFRATSKNFEEKSLSADDLVKLEIGRILKGQKTDSNGKEFNDKVKAFQREWRAVGDPANYRHTVVILGNLRKYNDSQIRKLTDNTDYTIFDFSRAYNELVFPLCSSTYHDPDEIEITINLGGKEHSNLKQQITTKYGEFQVRVIFVPAVEIGRVLSEYRNAILKFNPRNYLSLSENRVNRKIRDGILQSTTNDFAVLNNGITLICEKFNISETTASVDVGQIIMSNPQIINGGQTAYTLSEIYDHYTEDDRKEVFATKEVLLKVIIVKEGDALQIRDFIAEISNATNQQSRVEEADRRSNDPIQVKLQEKIYEKYDFLYERKRGEFYHALKDGYVDDSQVIDRYEFLRAYYAFKGNPRWARQRSNEVLFRKDYFESIMEDGSDHDNMVFAYRILKRLQRIENEGTDQSWGNGLRYGKMAVIAAIAALGIQNTREPKYLDRKVSDSIRRVAPQWRRFESSVRKKKENADYRDPVSNDFDFDNFYKGKTVDNAIREFFAGQQKAALQPHGA